MSSYDSINKKVALPPERNRDGSLRKASGQNDPARQVTPLVAHELNNILAIIQGYAERLLLRHSDDPALAPHLKLISEGSKRAAVILREATPADANNMFSQSAYPRPAQAAA